MIGNHCIPPFNSRPEDFSHISPLRPLSKRTPLFSDNSPVTAGSGKSSFESPVYPVCEAMGFRGPVERSQAKEI